MAFKFKGSLSAVDASLKGGVIFDNEKLSDSKIMPKGKFTINEIDESTTDLAGNTLVTNFGKQENIAGMFSFNTGDWKDTDSAPVKLMMRVVNDVNDSDWVTIFDSSKTTVTWSSIATAGQTQFTVPNLDFKKAIIYVNGVLQYPGLSYQTFGGTITFNSKLSTGDTIYVVVGEDTTNTDNEEFTATATEDQTVIVLPFTKKTNFVFINGILQYPDSYTVSGSTITLGDKLYLNDDILVLGNETDLVSFTALASQDQTDFTLPGEFDDGLVYINGVLQYDNAYSVSGTTLSFISSLDENDNVFVTLNDPKFIDSVNASYTSTITDESNNKLNIPYFNFSELQVFINGVLQNPDSGAYILNGTEITLSSPLQLGDDIHVIVYNSPVQNSNLVTKADLTSYATAEELQELKNSLKNEGINLKWQPHLPSIEVAFGLPRRSLKMWTVGSTSTVNQYWLYPVDGTVWTGTGTLGTVPDVPFYKLDSNKDVITWTYTATSDNVTRIFVPYNFGSITIFINGILQSVNLNHYTIDGQYVNLNGALQTGDNFIAILGKLVFNTNPYLTYDNATSQFVSKSTLSSNVGTSIIGTPDGSDLQQTLNNKVDTTILSSTTGASLIGTENNKTVQENINNLNEFNDNLQSTEDGEGASLVYLSQSGTVQDALYKIITVESFKNLVTDPNDWSPAFAAAAQKAKDIGASTVYFSGNYNIKPSLGYDFVMPFDDGTYDTRRTGEVTLTPEPEYRMAVGLNWPSGVSLKSSGIASNSLNFLWDQSTVDINQTIGICLRVRNWDGTYKAAVGSINRMNSDIANIEFDGFTIKNAAIGIVADGVVGSVTWGVLQFNNCGIAMSWLGGDRSTIKKIRMTNCASGFTIGGWWLTRNDISGSNTGKGVPPYVDGTDVYCIGWCDFVKIESLEYSNDTYWGSSDIFSKIDTFFNTYFYKNDNSKRTADGGRCTNTGTNLTSTSTLYTDSPFLGISKRALSQMGRYHRYHILNEVLSLKTWGCSRAAVLTTYNDSSELNVPGCIIGTAYIEQGCKLTRDGGTVVGGSNDFVTSGADNWPGNKTYSEYWGGEGSVVIMNGFPVNTLGLFGSARTVARNDNGYKNRMRRTIVDNGSGSSVIVEQMSPDVYQTPPQKFIPNSTGTVDSKYYWKYFEKDVSSQMTLYAGIPTSSSSTIVTTPSKRVFMERIGNRVKMKIVFDASNRATGGSEPVVIGFNKIYAPIISSNTSYSLNTYGPVKPIVITSTTFTITDDNSITRTIKINPVAYECGSFTDSNSVVNYYFILQSQTSTDSTYRFLWSDVKGSRFQIEIEYDTTDDITSSNVF